MVIWLGSSLVRFPRPTPRRLVRGPMSWKSGNETVLVSAGYGCPLMGECYTFLEFCLSKDSIGTPQVKIYQAWKVLGQFESRFRAKRTVEPEVRRGTCLAPHLPHLGCWLAWRLCLMAWTLLLRRKRWSEVDKSPMETTRESEGYWYWKTSTRIKEFVWFLWTSFKMG